MFNGYQGQLRASDFPDKTFQPGQELFNLIQQQCTVPIQYLSRIGIYARPGSEFLINNQPVIIGKTYMYETSNVEITSLKFVGSVLPQEIIIDYIIMEDDATQI